ncbi:MAG: sugar phosphate nucleotidyltransferase [bacterium]
MKIIIFAGGIGTRLWPLSRKNSPKQFDKIFNGKSTLELAIARVEPLAGIDNIFVQTIPEFVDAVREQIPAIPEKNIFVEPCRRNVGPAVCYGMMRLRNAGTPSFEEGGRGMFSTAGTGVRENEMTRDGADDNKVICDRALLTDNSQHAENPTPALPSKGRERDCESVALLWADHLMERVDEFQSALKLGDKLIQTDQNRFIFLPERPRFANNNLGWIKVGDSLGEIDGIDYFKFEGWKYKPEIEECDRMFKSGDYFWNPGYFISSVDFILEQYENLAPTIYANVKKSIDDAENAQEHYEKAEKVSFDRALIEKTDLSNAVVIKTNMGWSDPGTLYALKEALEKSRDANVVNGNVVELNTKDSLLYNFEKKKILAAVGLDGFVVINTEDALIVVPKEEVVHVTNLVEKMGKLGLEEYL